MSVFPDCPEVSADGLCRLTGLSKLQSLTLHGVSAAAMTDAKRWLQELSRSLRSLDISGELRWHIHTIDIHERTVVTVNRLLLRCRQCKIT